MKKIFSLVLILNSSLALACHYCVGTTQGGKDQNTTLILGGFILSMYIPYFIILRLIKKQKAFKAGHDSSGPA
jgi:hypothetical protein